MTHVATLNRLTEALVSSITGLLPDENAVAFGKLKDQAAKNLRDHNHARTNQFAIKSTLDGLIEKFAVLNRDDLAEALQIRLEEHQNTRWTPEIFSLLLELSDRPAEKTSTKDIINASQPSATHHELTWSDILATDPLEKSDIWDNVERGYHSSGDDEFEHENDSELTISTRATSVCDDPGAIARLHLVQPNGSILADIQTAREFWDARQDETLRTSELNIVREMLSMLHGLPTDLLRNDGPMDKVRLARNVVLTTASRSSLSDVLRVATETGTSLNFLRRWTSSSLQHSFQQSMQASIQSLLSNFNRHLCLLEQRYLAPPTDTTVSAIHVLAEVQNYAVPLTRMSLLVQVSSMATGPESHFTLLDHLYEELNVAQITGDVSLVECLCTVFLAGLRTYLRPIATWIQTGTVAPRDHDIFFIIDADQHCDPGDFWQRRFEMRSRSDGTPFAPKCMLPFAARAFALGKTQSFLHILNIGVEGEKNPTFTIPGFDTFSQRIRKDMLMPFEQRLSDTVERWISMLSTDYTSILHSELLEYCGFEDTLHALPYIYFCKDGALFQAFAETLLDQMGKSSMTAPWSDQFLLTELAQNTLGSSKRVTAESIYVSIPKEKSEIMLTATVRRLGSVKIEYALSWPIQNITRSRNPPLLSEVFALLLQIFHAARLISNRFFDFRTASPGSSTVLRLWQKLSWFVNLIYAHTTTTAATQHAEMSVRIKSAEDIDAMVAIWADYEKRLGKSLLLSANLSPVRDSVVSLLELCEILSKNPRPKRVAALHDQFDEALTFLIAGLRGVSRAAGESALETLAERLESSVG